jgi:hypothetical protein
MKKIIRITIFALIFLILGCGIYFYCYYYLWIKMDSNQINKAEIALNSGIIVNDAENDYAPMGDKENKEEKPNNPHPYNFPFLDIKSVSFGMDDEYLYCKVQFNGVVPGKSPQLEKDRIGDYGVKINLVDRKGEDQVVMHMDYDFLVAIPGTFGSCFYSYGPTGIKFPEDAGFAKRGEDCKVSGGSGTDFLFGAFPVKKMGVAPGQELYIALSAEAGSQVYDHAAVDVLGGHGKMPAVIKWTAGTTKYEINDDFYAQ